jgi:hypothetical protein
VSTVRNVDFSVLTCVVSLILRSPILPSIYNLCRNINLTSPVYFVHGGKWNVTPNQKIHAGSVMKNRVRFDFGQDLLDGVLIYRIQRRHMNFDDEDEDELTCQLLIAWHVEHTKRLDVRVLVVKHDEFDWNGDKLKQLYQKCWQPLSVLANSIGSNWLLDDTTVLETMIKTMNEGYRWDIFISERRTYESFVKPLWIDVERWVSMMCW